MEMLIKSSKSCVFTLLMLVMFSCEMEEPAEVQHPIGARIDKITVWELPLMPSRPNVCKKELAGGIETKQNSTAVCVDSDQRFDNTSENPQLPIVFTFNPRLSSLNPDSCLFGLDGYCQIKINIFQVWHYCTPDGKNDDSSWRHVGGPALIFKFSDFYKNNEAKGFTADLTQYPENAIGGKLVISIEGEWIY